MEMGNCLAFNVNVIGKPETTEQSRSGSTAAPDHGNMSFL